MPPTTSLSNHPKPKALPHDVLHTIFTFLSAKDLCACLRVSKRWGGIAGDDVVWRETTDAAYARYPGTYVHKTQFPSWKKYYEYLSRPLCVASFQDVSEEFPLVLVSSECWAQVATSRLFGEFRASLQRNLGCTFIGIDKLDFETLKGVDVLMLSTSGPQLEEEDENVIRKYLHSGGMICAKLCAVEFHSLSRVLGVGSFPYHNAPNDFECKIKESRTQHELPNGPFGDVKHFKESCPSCLIPDEFSALEVLTEDFNVLVASKIGGIAEGDALGRGGTLICFSNACNQIDRDMFAGFPGHFWFNEKLWLNIFSAARKGVFVREA